MGEKFVDNLIVVIEVLKENLFECLFFGLGICYVGVKVVKMLV